MLALESRVAAAQDRLTQVLEAMRQVALHLLGNRPAGGETRVDLQDIVKAMQLVSHASGEDGVLVALDRVRQVVVLCRVFYLDIAETLCARELVELVAGWKTL